MARKNRFFNWREDLHEYLGTNTSMADRANAVPAKAKTDTKAQKKIDTAKVNNKVVINPPMKEAFEEIGGILLEVVEFTEDTDLDQMKKDAESNRENFKKGSVKRDKYHTGSAQFAAAKVADDVKKASRTGPQQYKGTRTGVKRVD